MRDGDGDVTYGEVAVVGMSRGSDGSDAVLVVRSVCHGMVVSWQPWEVVDGRGDGCDEWSSGGGGGGGTMRM